MILSKNLYNTQCTKHIEMGHHFLRDHMLKGDIILEFVRTEC
jgi:hypothetical protein